MSKKFLGILSTVTAAIMFGINPSVQNFLLLEGVSAIGCTFFTILAATCLLFVCCLVTKTSFQLTKAQYLPVLLCGICIFLTDWLLEVAYTKIPVGFATMIHFLYPTLICVTTLFLFKKKISHHQILTICLSFAGLALISGGTQRLNTSGIMIAFITAIAYAAFLVMADLSALKELPSLTFSFYVNLINAGLCFAVLIFSGSSVPASFSQFKLVLISSALLAFATVFQNKGVKLLGSFEAALISTLEPLTSVLTSVFLFAYSLPLFSMIGCILILASLIFAEGDQ